MHLNISFIMFLTDFMFISALHILDTLNNLIILFYLIQFLLFKHEFTN